MPVCVPVCACVYLCLCASFDGYNALGLYLCQQPSPGRGEANMYPCTVCVCRVLINMQLYLLLLHVWSCPLPPASQPACLLLLSPPFRAHSKVRDCDFASSSSSSTSASASRILACVDCRLACPASTLQDKHATTLSPPCANPGSALL